MSPASYLTAPPRVAWGSIAESGKPSRSGEQELGRSLEIHPRRAVGCDMRRTTVRTPVRQPDFDHDHLPVRREQRLDRRTLPGVPMRVVGEDNEGPIVKGDVLRTASLVDAHDLGTGKRSAE